MLPRRAMARLLAFSWSAGALLGAAHGADTTPPALLRVLPAAGAVVRSFSEVEVQFSEPVTGVDAADLRVNGQPAAGVSGAGAGPYRFTFAAPSPGLLQLAWASGHGIRDTSPEANPFSGGSWTLQLSPQFDAGQLVLNELAAENKGDYLDEEGDPSDWIELRNRGSQPVQLAGWSLTDDPDQPHQWLFPEVTLNPGQYLVVFASGKNRRETAGGARLHTGFKLGGSGETVLLVGPEYPAQEVQRVVFPEQREGYTYGLNASGNCTYFDRPTPGAANSTGVTFLGVVPEPQANVRGGFFKEAFPLVLSCPLPGVVIRYTTNGSVPTLTNGSTYNTPLTLSGSANRAVVTLRAAAFRNGYLSSRVGTWTYIFPELVMKQPQNPTGFPAEWVTRGGRSIPADYEMDPDVLAMPGASNRIYQSFFDLPSVSIVMKTDDLFHTSSGIYSNPRDFGILWERPASAEFLMPGGTPLQIDCGIRIQGGSSREENKTRKHSFRLLFKGDYGAGKLNLDLFPESPVRSFDTLVLDANLNFVFHHPDHAQRVKSQYVRDLYMSDLQRLMGHPAVHGRFAHLWLNGLYWGLIWIHERPDDAFAAAYLGGRKQEFDALKNTDNSNLEAVAGDLNAWNTLMSLANAGLATEAQYQQLQQYLDLPNLIDYMILNIWGGNVDWPFKNWYAIRRRAPGEGFKFVSWDAEKTLELENENRSTVSDANSPARLYDQLRTHNAEFRLLFADHIHRHFFNGGLLYVNPASPGWDPAHPGRNVPAALYTRRIEEIDRAIVAESARWGDTHRDNQPYTRENEWLTELNRMRNSYFPVRSSNVLQQFRTANLYPMLDAPVFSQHGGWAPSGFLLDMSLPSQAVAGVPLPRLEKIYFTTNGVDPRVYGSGDIAQDAVEYAQPLALTRSVRVKARTRGLRGEWSALNEAEFTVGELGLPLRFTEIMYHPIGGEAFEYLELQNIGLRPVDLADFTFSGIAYAFPSGASIAPGQVLVLASKAHPASFSQRYPGVTPFGYFGGALDNGGERLALLNREGQVVAAVTYDDENGWPLEADGGGASLEILDPWGNPDDPANWRASPVQGGSPGTFTPPAPGSSAVILNELMADNRTSTPNGGRYPDWVELRNTGGSAANLSGWSLSDDSNPRRYVFPAGTSIPAGGYLVVWCDSAAGEPGLYTGFGLNQRGDSLFLYNASTQRVDAISFGLQLPDRSIGRLPGGWNLAVPTPGAANQPAALAAPASLRVNEWMARPVRGSDWLEIYNASASAPAPLQGLYLGNGAGYYPLRALSFVPAGGHVQLFAEERSGPDQAGFKLPGEGGVIALFEPSGAEIHRVTYGAQEAGVSEGFLPDGSATLRSFPGTESPGAPNYATEYSGPLLNEVMARNAGIGVSPTGDLADWIELYNPNTTAYPLGGMSLSLDPFTPGEWIFPTGLSIPPRGYLLVWCDGTHKAATDPAFLNLGRSLAAEGGGIALFNPQGQVVDWIRYGFQVRNASIGRAGSGWKLLSAPTPGGANSPAATLGGLTLLRINEWMARPRQGSDWVELHNGNPLPVELSKLYLTDRPDLPGQTRFQVGPLSFIGGRNWVRFIADDSPGSGPHHLNFQLDGGSGELLRIYHTNRTLLTELGFGPQIEGASEGRLIDGGTTLSAFSATASPGAANHLPVSTFQVAEILPVPAPGLEAYVEVRNQSSFLLDLGNWFLSDDPSDPKKFRVPPGTFLQPGTARAFTASQLGSGFQLNGLLGGVVVLAAADSGGNLTGPRFQAAYPPLPPGLSFGLHPASHGMRWTPLASPTRAEPNSPPRASPVVLHEIHFDPVDIVNGTVVERPAEEFIELYNGSASAVPLHLPDRTAATWRIRGGVDYEFPPGSQIPPRSYWVVVGFDPQDAQRLAAFRLKFQVPDAVPVTGPWRGRLDNAGERIELLRPLDPVASGALAGHVPYTPADVVEYAPASPWPVAARNGRSLQRSAATLFGDDPASWIADSPTAGRANAGADSDLDNDGMPDAWEAQFGFDRNDPADALLDKDGDGMSNRDEYRAGTDPESAASRLHIEEISITGGEIRLKVQVVAGRRYLIRQRSSWSANWTIWQEIASAPQSGTLVISGPASGTQQFFQVLLPLD